MAGPTVRISETSRQALRQLAERTGQSMQALLDRAVEEYRRKLFLDAVNAGYAALRSDPAAWAALQAERRLLDTTLLDGLDPEERWTADGVVPPKAKRKKA
jgi:hypothetical protein